jgi:hypothetical protein
MTEAVKSVKDPIPDNSAGCAPIILFRSVSDASGIHKPAGNLSE